MATSDSICSSVQRMWASRLVAGAVAELGEAQRQVLVGAQAAVEDLERAGAVHRLHREDALLALRDEHVLLVVAPVAAALPERARHDRGGVHLLVAVLADLVAHVLLQRDVDRPALRMPEDLAGVLGVEVEEVQLHAEAAVVAALGLLDAGERRVDVRLRLRGDAVEALHHRVARVAAVVGPRHGRDLERLDAAGRRHVRAAAEVPVVAALVERDRLALGDVREALDLVGLAASLEELPRLLARHLDALEGVVRLRDLGHLGLDRGEVLLAEAVLEVEVVVESVVRRGSDVELRVGPELGDGVCHDVRRTVAQGLDVHVLPVCVRIARGSALFPTMEDVRPWDLLD